MSEKKTTEIKSNFEPSTFNREHIYFSTGKCKRKKNDNNEDDNGNDEDVNEHQQCQR